jgi:hypothetical protein
MAAPALAATVRYVAPSKRKYYYVPTIANPAAPSAAELNAGTDLSGQVFDAVGWTVTSNLVAVPDFSSRFSPKIAGEIVVADPSSLILYMSSTSADVRSLLTRDLTGYVVIFLEGITAGMKMDVFTVTVSSASKHQDGVSTAAMIEIQFGITAVPSLDVTVPAGL